MSSESSNRVLIFSSLYRGNGLSFSLQISEKGNGRPGIFLNGCLQGKKSSHISFDKPQSVTIPVPGLDTGVLFLNPSALELMLSSCIRQQYVGKL